MSRCAASPLARAPAAPAWQGRGRGLQRSSATAWRGRARCSTPPWSGATRLSISSNIYISTYLLLRGRDTRTAADLQHCSSLCHQAPYCRSFTYKWVSALHSVRLTPTPSPGPTTTSPPATATCRSWRRRRCSSGTCSRTPSGRCTRRWMGGTADTAAAGTGSADITAPSIATMRVSHHQPCPLRPKRTSRFTWPLPPRNASLVTSNQPPPLTNLDHNKPTQPQPDPDSRYTSKRFAVALA